MSNEDDIARINGIISPLVKNGQSLHQIYLAHVDELMCSEKTLYNYVDAQLFDIRNIDLPRKVKYRPRYKKPEFKVDRGCRIERSYADFQKYLGANPEFPIVKDTTPNMMNPRLYTTSYNKPQGQQFDDTAVLSFIKLQYT